MGDILTCNYPRKHMGKWLLPREVLENGVHSEICFACGVLALEDPCQLTVHKTAVLRELLSLLKSSPESVMALMEKQMKLAYRVISITLDLINFMDENVSCLAAECFVLSLCHLRNENLVATEMKTLEIMIQDECNYQQSLLKLRIVGRLLQLHPKLSKSLFQESDQFLQYLIPALVYPSDDVKSAVLFIFIHAYHSLCISSVSVSFYQHLTSGILLNLKESEDKTVLFHALGLLSVIIKSEPVNVTDMSEFHIEGTDFAVVAKKLLLVKDTTLQICMVQCICHTLMKPSKFPNYISVLMDANIPELLFEILQMKNELLIESVFCCIFHFSDNSTFFTKCHAIYGMESVIQATSHLLCMQNWRLSAIGWNLMAIIFSSQYSISLVQQGAVFQNTVKLLHATFKINNPSLLLAATHFLSAFFKKKNLPWPLPMSITLNTFHTAMKSIMRFLHTTISDSSGMKRLEKILSSGRVPFEVNVLLCSLQVVLSFSSLGDDFAATSLTMEEAFVCPGKENLKEDNSDEHFMKLFLHSAIMTLDAIFIPFVLQMKCTKMLRNFAAIHLVIILHDIYEKHWQKSTLLYALTQKFIICGFLKKILEMRAFHFLLLQNDTYLGDFRKISSSCLKYMFWCVLQNEEVVGEEYFKYISVGIELLDENIENCVPMLSQMYDSVECVQDDGFSSVTKLQITLLFYLYISYKYNVQIVAIKILLQHISFFATSCTDLHLPNPTLKHLVYLLAVCTCDSLASENDYYHGLHLANEAVLEKLSKLSSYSHLYLHEKVILWWCFMYEKKSCFTSYVFETWLSSSLEVQNNSDREALLFLLSRNEYAQLAFMDCLESHAVTKVLQAFDFLKLSWNDEVRKHENDSMKASFERFLDRIMEQISLNLIKYFMTSTNSAETEEDKRICILLECLQWIHQQSNKNFLSSETEMKLVFYVVNLCSNRSEDSYVLSTCFTFLHSVINGNLYSYDHRVWHIVSGNQKFMHLMEVLVSSNNNCHHEAVKLLGTLVNYQVESSVKSTAEIKVPSTSFFKWLKLSQEFQVLTCLLMRNLIKVNFQNVIVSITPCGHTSLFSQEDSCYSYLSSLGFRKLVHHLQDAVIVVQPVSSEVIVLCLLDLIDFVKQRNPEVGKHIMLQPWFGIMLEEWLHSCDITSVCTFNLFSKWLCYKVTNSYVIPAVQHFAEAVSSLEVSSISQSNVHVITEMCDGPYSTAISELTRNKLKAMIAALNTQVECKFDENDTLFSHVEELIHSCVTIPELAFQNENV